MTGLDFFGVFTLIFVTLIIILIIMGVKSIPQGMEHTVLVNIAPHLSRA